MSDFEVPEPIINTPFEEPQQHWYIAEGRDPELRPGRRPAMYFYRDPAAKTDSFGRGAGTAIELLLVNRIRQRVKAWREAGWPGATGTTQDLLSWWTREGRERPLFFAQVEAAETIIFLNEARSDFLQGVSIPREEVSAERLADGYKGLLRYACKMATGSGKTTVMGMIAAWTILNKVYDRGNARFSDVVLVVCPNVTIRDRLRELDPALGPASLYWTRDLVPPDMRANLTDGRVLVTNWHIFEPRSIQAAGVNAKVVKAGVPVRVRETIHIGSKTTTARGNRYLTQEVLQRYVAAGLILVLEEERDKQGNLTKVFVEATKYVESDSALVTRVLGREVGGKRNILVMNDEAHHAYRIRKDEPDEDQDEMFGDDDMADEFFKEATVWVDGLDRIHKLRGINFCLDLSATPYFLGRVGQDTNRPFPWVVSDFGLIDAIESGLTKIPQLAVRDSTGADIPGYFNIWHWILPQLSSSERGGKRSNPKPEAIVKFANTPIAMLAGLWQQEFEDRKGSEDPRPPVFILVCKNIALAKVIYEWIGENRPPTGIPPLKIKGFHNTPRCKYTIRVDSRVADEAEDLPGAKGDETRWMRFTLATVGKADWPTDRLGRPIYPEGFQELARKLERPLHPPGRDVRCIVSVAMLTEGWDCNTVTHIVGLRPFMSQLLCEQVVGRGLRRMNYDVDANGRFTEEVAKVFGVPFEVIPFKATKGAAMPRPKRHHVLAISARSEFEITFPRVDGYTQAIQNRLTVHWDELPPIVIDPLRIPPEVDVKGLSLNNQGRLTLTGPGRLDEVSLKQFRSQRRTQEMVFELAQSLTRDFLAQGHCEIPAHALFPQLVQIVQRYVHERVRAAPPADVKDVFLSPYFGWVVERLLSAIRPDTSQGEAAEVPRYEANRGPGSTADVDYWTSKQVREVLHSHVNYVVADTLVWEQAAAYIIDRHKSTAAFVKNAGLGFSIPYLHNGQRHDYVPDFIIRVNDGLATHLILETKGWDTLAELKIAAARRWVAAVNADGAFGIWRYEIARKVEEIKTILDAVAPRPSLDAVEV